MIVEFYRLAINCAPIGINPEHVVKVIPAPRLFRRSNTSRSIIYLSNGDCHHVACDYKSVIFALNQADQTKQIADWWNGNGPDYLADKISRAISEGFYQGRAK